jgi:hypothetical protein
MTKKYVEYKQIDENIDHVNAWYKECQRDAVPYVIVRSRRKYADIQWDHLNLPKEADDTIRSKGDDFRNGFVHIFRKHAGLKSEYRLGSFVVEFLNIDTARATAAAADMYDYVLSELSLAKSEGPGG